MKKATTPRRSLDKVPTGIQGLDELTLGGLPKGRPTLICGSTGCGKTLFGMMFLLNGIQRFDEPGVFMSFEETANELGENVESLGYDLRALIAKKKLIIDNVRIDRSEIEETGEYDLEAIFIRLGHAIDTIGAKRVVLDTIEVLFGSLKDHAILRSELRRLFTWLKTKGVTAIITAERGDGELSRSGLEEYVSDCVILLDHRVNDQVSTRRLRIVKYRGSAHGTNEYPFLIDANEISVAPLSAAGLDYPVSEERISTGVAKLDEMFGGKGYFRGSSILISGAAGTGKSSLAAQFALSRCKAGERVLYLAFEESPEQIVRNMRSIGVDLGAPRDKGLLVIQSARPTLFGLELHLATMHKKIVELNPSAVILDPISNFGSTGTQSDATSMLVRLVDIVKAKRITAMFVNLATLDASFETTETGLSSIADTWIVLRNIDLGNERKRVVSVLKSRGMHHSNQIREFLLSSHGIELRDVNFNFEGTPSGIHGIKPHARVDREKNTKPKNKKEKLRGTAL
jgi:circadian clock protein KaiC